MLAREQVHNLILFALERKRIAAAQEIIKIALSKVHIKRFVARFCCNIIGKFNGESVRLTQLILNISVGGNLFRHIVDKFIGMSVAAKRANLIAFAAVKRNVGRSKAAADFVLIMLIIAEYGA